MRLIVIAALVACRTPATDAPYRQPARFFPHGVFADPSAGDPGDATAEMWATILTRLREPQLRPGELRVTLHRSFDTDLSVRLTRNGARTIATFSETDVRETGEKRLAARTHRVLERDWRRVTQTLGTDQLRSVSAVVPRCDPVPAAPASTVREDVDGDALVVEISGSPPAIVTCRVHFDGNWWLVELEDAHGYHAFVRRVDDGPVDRLAREVFALARK